MIEYTAEQVREGIEKFEQFCTLTDESGDPREALLVYLTEYLGFPSDAQDVIADYAEEDPELRQFGEAIGEIEDGVDGFEAIRNLYISGIFLGLSIAEERDPTRTVVVPDALPEGM